MTKKYTIKIFAQTFTLNEQEDLLNKIKGLAEIGICYFETHEIKEEDPKPEPKPEPFPYKKPAKKPVKKIKPKKSKGMRRPSKYPPEMVEYIKELGPDFTRLELCGQIKSKFGIIINTTCLTSYMRDHNLTKKRTPVGIIKDEDPEIDDPRFDYNEDD